MSGSLDRQFYDSTERLDRVALRGSLTTIRLYFESYRSILTSHFEAARNVTTLEMGAGTCALSLLVSQFDFVSRVTCFDISAKKMRDLLPISSDFLGAGETSKLEFLEGDFGVPLAFPDQSLDLILFDASLHHSRSIWNTLAECRRLLKPGGMLVAQREQYLGTLTFGRKLSRLLATEEVLAGVAENAYFKEQYDYYFRACGFTTRFLPVAESALQRLLLPLNGLIFSKWNLLAYRN